jgi:hypothetical protein
LTIPRGKPLPLSMTSILIAAILTPGLNPDYAVASGPFDQVRQWLRQRS